jgi:hypothetical protein
MRLLALIGVLVVALAANAWPFAAPSVALADADTFYLGSGRDGALTVSTTGLVVNAYAPVTAPLAPGDISISYGTVVGAGTFAAGDLLLVLQTTGIVPEPSSGGASLIDLSSSPVGRWELARVSSASAGSLNLAAPLVYSYSANVTQIVRVPEYTTVTINATRSISPRAWNGSTGGVVAFLASGTVTNNGSIDARGSGFRGGQPVDDSSGTTGCAGLDQAAPGGGQKGEGIAATRYGASITGRGHVANGGAGGVCFYAGGGGGGNGGAGGQGGNSELTIDGNRAVGGEGGASLTFSLLDHLLMGGGGGAGHSSTVAGGAGGGIVFIRASALSGSGTVYASGSSSSASANAASGGGAGGTIYLRVAGAATCGSIQAAGGTGGTSNSMAVGPGGGGGGGRILLQKGSGTCTLTGTSVIGASSGVQQDPSASGGSVYGATAGVNGSITTLTGGFPNLNAPVVVTPANGSTTNNSKPTYAGTLAPTIPSGTQVTIVVDNGTLATVTPDASGNWTYTPASNLSDGSHTIRAFAVNSSQAIQSLSSSTSIFTVDTTPPPAPVTSTPANGSTTSNSKPAISGTAEAGSTVTVVLDGNAVGTTTANASGNWSFTPSSALADGSHNARARATDAAGNTGVDSATNTFTVDTTPPPAPVTSTPANGSTTSNSKPALSGTAEAGSTVTVVLDGNTLGTITANGAGSWSYTPGGALSDGSHTVRAHASDAAGNVGPNSNTNTFTVDTTPPPAPVVSTPANGSITNNDKPAIGGTAEAGSTVTVVLDGNTLGMTTADVSGNWSHTPGSALSDGSHTVTAHAADEAGNTGGDSASNTFSVDTTPASPPQHVVYLPLLGARAPSALAASVAQRSTGYKR